MKSQHTVIVDTSALISLLSEDDSLHEQAVTLATQLRHKNQLLIIPAEVLAETLVVLRPRVGKEKTVAIGTELLSSPEITVVPTQQQTLHQTLTKLMETTGGPSYIDCLVMATADEYQTTQIFGFDAAFDKNGYVLPEAEQAA